MAFQAQKIYICDTCNNTINIGEEFSWSRRGPRKNYCYKCSSLKGNKKEQGGEHRKGENDTPRRNPDDGIEYDNEQGNGNEEQGDNQGQGKGKGEGQQDQGNEQGDGQEGDNNDDMKYDIELPTDMEHMRRWLEETGMLDADMQDETIKEVLTELYVEWKKEHPEEEQEQPQEQEEQQEEEDQDTDNHENYNLLITFLKEKEHVYLWGPAGSGKSTAAEKAAEDLGLDYGYVSLDPYASSTCLIGYMNATGGYVKTPFYDIYKNGGVFCVDELDNASSSLLVTLNSALANGMCAFPCGMVKRHENFRLVATGNTDGKGGTPQYPERRQLDSAVLDRYLAIHWGYDEKLELSIALQIDKQCGAEAAKFVQDVRKRAIELAPDLIVSPRSTIRITKLMKLVPKRTLVESTLFKGYDEGTVSEIMKGMWNKWQSC